MTFSEKLKKLRKEKKITQEKLAAIIGVERSSIGKYESTNVMPSIDVLNRIAAFFEVSVDYLLGNDSAINLSLFGNIFPIEKKKIPLLGDIACGKPIYADEDRESYVIAGTNVNADFCLRAKGDSMIGARILDGDVVFIQKADIVNNGEIAAVIIEDEETLKRVYYYPESQKLVLNAENPKYEPLVYVDSELEQIHILGKAVAFQSDVR